MAGLPILSITIFIPLIGALMILGVRMVGGANLASSASKSIALLTSIVTLGASLVALAGFDAGKTGYQFIENVAWFGGSSYKLGVDGADDRADAAVRAAVLEVDRGPAR